MRLLKDMLQGDAVQTAQSADAENAPAGLDVKRITFCPTEPLSTYLFSFVAGKFQRVTEAVTDRVYRFITGKQTRRIAQDRDYF